MKIIWYLGMFLTGALGALLALRSLELLLTGGGLRISPLAMALLALVGAYTCWQKARQAGRAHRHPSSTSSKP